MPNTEKWYNRDEFTEYLNCEIRDFKTGNCSDEIEVPEYRIEAILAHHRELIVKEIRGEIEKMKEEYSREKENVSSSHMQVVIKERRFALADALDLPCLKENE